MTYHLYPKIDAKQPIASTNRLDILRHKAAGLRSYWVIRHGRGGNIVLSRRSEQDNAECQACYSRPQQSQGALAIHTIANTATKNYTTPSPSTASPSPSTDDQAKAPITPAKACPGPDELRERVPHGEGYGHYAPKAGSMAQRRRIGYGGPEHG